VIKAFLADGMNPDARDDEGRTALGRAALAGETEVVKALIAGGADVNVRHRSVRTALI
jgi:ankyrin repeat protein